jgi:hypothetical protein
VCARPLLAPDEQAHGQLRLFGLCDLYFEPQATLNPFPRLASDIVALQHVENEAGQSFRSNSMQPGPSILSMIDLKA